MPLGTLAPMARYFSGFFNKLTTSCSSFTQSSMPLTSLKVTETFSAIVDLGGLGDTIFSNA